MTERSSESGSESALESGKSGFAQIEIPPDALPQDTTISLEYAGPANEKEDVTDLYMLKPFGIIFSKPVLVQLPYDEALLKKQGLTEDKIRLFIWTEEGEKRSVDFIIDRENKLLKTELVQF